MNNLTLLEQGLVPVYTTDTGEHVVDGRELWEGLGSKSKFADWIKNKFSDCEAKVNEDFETFSKNLENGGRTKEYIIKLDTAKEMAMLENNKIGKQVRKYFIAVEKKSKQAVVSQAVVPQMDILSTTTQSLINMEVAQWEQATEIQKIKEDVRVINEKLTPKKQVKIAPMQTELTLAEEFYSKTLKKDRITTEQIACMYLLSAREFYKKLQILGLVVPSPNKGWLLHEDYEDKGIGFTESKWSDYQFVTWSEKGLKLITSTLKNNGIVPKRRLPQRKKMK